MPDVSGDAVVIESGGMIVVSEKVCVAVSPPLSATCTVKLDTPAAVGVPLSTPAVLKASPAGSVPLVTLHE